MKHSVFTVLLPDRTLEEVFHLLRDVGYDGVEVRVQQDYHVAPDRVLSQVPTLARAMADTGLEIPVLATYLTLQDRKALLPVFEAADQLGARGVRVGLGPPLDGTRSYREVLAEAQQGLKGLIEAIRPFRARAFFEIHFRTVIASPSLAYLLLEPFDPGRVGVIFDPGNMIVEGREDWRVGLEVVREYLEHVHVKNASWHRKGGWQWKWDTLEDGMADWSQVVAALVAVGYQGYLSNENLSGVSLPGATGFIGEKLSGEAAAPRRPIETQLREDLEYLKRLAANLGGPCGGTAGGGA